MQSISLNEYKIGLDLGKGAKIIDIYLTNGPYGSGTPYRDQYFDLITDDFMDPGDSKLVVEALILRSNASGGEELQGTIRHAGANEISVILPSSQSIIIKYQTSFLCFSFNRKIVLGWDITAENSVGVCPLEVVNPLFVISD